MKQHKTILSESILREAFGIYAGDLLLEYPPPPSLAGTHEFSPEFEDKMEKLLNKQKKPWAALFRTASRRIAMITIGVLLSLTITVFGVEAIRKPFIEFIVRTFETFTDVVFPPSDSAEDQINYILPTYIPSGYTLDSLEQDPLGQKAIYLTEDGIDLVYEQVGLAGSSWSLDTEGTTLEEITVEGMSGLFFNNKGYNNLLFNDDTYSFYLSGTVSKDELIKIAKNLK